MGLLGYPRTGLRNTYYNFFIQDDIQATRKLTLMAGLRYQYETSPADANNRQSNFDPATGRGYPGAQLMNMPWTNFGPRFGFAYSPFDSGNTVIRGAYGIYFVNFNATLVQNTPTNTGHPTTISLTRHQVPDLVGFPFPDISSFSGVRVSAPYKGTGIRHTCRTGTSTFSTRWLTICACKLVTSPTRAHISSLRAETLTAFCRVHPFGPMPGSATSPTCEPTGSAITTRCRSC